MATERTYFMVKPDGVKRGLVGEILARIERRGFAVRGLKQFTLDQQTAESHYAEHKDKPFFGELVEFITSGPVVGMVLEGENAVSVVRTMMGTTHPKDSAPGTIRGDFALEMGENVVHGSDSVESAEREIALYFTDAELGLARA